MAIIINTDNPGNLKTEIVTRIKLGDIPTWEIDEDGDLTCSNIRWKDHAWFKIYEEENRLVFGIVASLKYGLTNEIYGVYHGRFASTLLAYFAGEMSEVILNPNLDKDYDKF